MLASPIHMRHPPYSRIVMTVTPGTAKVIYGAALDIRAVAHGQAVDNLESDCQRPRLSGEERTPMFPDPVGNVRPSDHISAQPA